MLRVASSLLPQGASIVRRSTAPAVRLYSKGLFSPAPAPRRTLLSSGGGMGGGNGGAVRRAATGGPGDAGKPNKGLWARYLELLEAQPMLTRVVTCAVLNGLGDIFCQLFLEKQELDAKRCIRFTLMGLLFVGPILTMWYGQLGRIVTAPGTKGVVLSVLLDQLFFAPIFISAIMSVLTTIEGKPQNIMRKLKQDLPEAIKVNWMLWVPAQVINFVLVPPNLRMLAVNVVALAWNMYLSFQGHKAVVDEPAATAGKQ